MKIVTEKDSNWTAIDTDTYDGSEDSGNRNHIGHGDTEQEAIANLIQIMEDSDGYYDADEIAAAKASLPHDERHGGPHDCGSADSYYGRPFGPHYWTGGTGKGLYIGKDGMTEDEIAAYAAGYAQNEADHNKKSWA
jgi:hypothetical protein